MEKVKSIVTSVKRSIRASDNLKEVQLQDGKTEGTSPKLIQDVPTRWTTKVDMLKRYIESEHYLYLAISKSNIDIDLVNREEMKILKDVLPMMEFVKDLIS